MFKHIFVIVLLSLLVVLFMPYAQQGLQYLVSAHDWINETLMQVFSGGSAGNITRQLLALLIVPFLFGLIPATIYWMVKRSWLPCFMEIVWVIWLVQTSALVILFKVAEAAVA